LEQQNIQLNNNITDKIKNLREINIKGTATIISLILIIVTITILFFRRIKRTIKRLNIQIDDNLNLKKTKQELLETRLAYVETKEKEFINKTVLGVMQEIKTNLSRVVGGILYNKKQVDRLSVQINDNEKATKYFDKINEHNEMILNDLENSFNMIRDLNSFSSEQIFAKINEKDLGKFIKDTLQLLKINLDAMKVRYQIVCQEDIKIKTYSGYIFKIIQNLVLNTLEHGFAERDLPDKFIRISVSNEGSDVIVKFFNNGSHISPEHLPLIFDQNFSTKPPEKNQIYGLGLFRVQHMVKNNLKGTITCASSEGQGVTFIIVFPKEY
jgi:signal transduction histidine kinase